MAATTTDAIRDSSAAYAKRHAGRTARADGTIALIFASQAAMSELSTNTARALKKDEVRVDPLPAWVQAGVRQGFMINVLGLCGEIPDDVSTVMTTLQRMANLPNLAEAFTSASVQKSTEQMLRNTKVAVLDPKRDSLRNSLQLSLTAGSKDASALTDDDVHAQALATGYAMEVRAAVLGHAEVVPRRGRGNPQKVLNDALLSGVLLHFAANGFELPTSYDLADLSLACAFEDGVDREVLSRRWKTRLSTPLAVETSQNIAGWFEGPDEGEQGQAIPPGP
jgi:hypothetical protein